MLEKDVVKSIRKALDKHYPGFYFKTHGGPFQRAGLPDIMGVHQGRFIGIEVKRPGKKHNESSIQEYVRNRISLAGGIAFVATSQEEVINKLKEVFANGKSRKKRSNKGTAT
jgi:hypothetical protein